MFRIARSIAAGMIALAFPYLVLTHYHYGTLTLGLLYTAGAVATAGFGLLCGFLADVWGRKKTLFLVGAFLPISSALVFLSPKLSSLFLAAMLGGFSATGSLMGGGVGGAAQPIQSAVIADLTAAGERTAFFSWFAFLSGVAAAGGALFTRLFGVVMVFRVATLMGLLSVALLLPMKVPEKRGSLRRLASKRTIGQFSLTGALNGFSQGLIVPFLIPFFVIVYHLPRAEMAGYAFASGLLGACALLAAPALDRRWGFVKTIAVTRGVGAFLLVLMPLSHFFLVALTVYLVTPALRVAGVPVQQTALTEMVSQEERGRALGLNQVSRLAASAGAITFTGSLFDVDLIGLPFYLYAVVMTVNIALYYRFFGKLELPEAE